MKLQLLTLVAPARCARSASAALPPEMRAAQLRQPAGRRCSCAQMCASVRTHRTPSPHLGTTRGLAGGRGAAGAAAAAALGSAAAAAAPLPARTPELPGALAPAPLLTPFASAGACAALAARARVAAGSASSPPASSDDLRASCGALLLAAPGALGPARSPGCALQRCV